MEAVRLIQNCWLAYLAYRTTLFQYAPTIPWTTRTNINVASLNIRGGLDLFIKRSYIAHKCTSTDLDFMAIIDSNHKSPAQLRWNTTHLPDSDTEDSPWDVLETNYTIHASTPVPDPPTRGRGLVLLAHNRLSRRKIRTKQGSQERWIANWYTLAEGVLTIMVGYGRPSVSHHNFHSERQEVIDYIQKCHHKNESVLLLGDYNLSYNDSTHRLHPNTTSAHPT